MIVLMGPALLGMRELLMTSLKFHLGETPVYYIILSSVWYCSKL